jgi:hypothetical protein
MLMFDADSKAFLDKIHAKSEYQKAFEIARVVSWLLPYHICEEMMTHGRIRQYYFDTLPFTYNDVLPYIRWVYTHALILKFVERRIDESCSKNNSYVSTTLPSGR